MKRRMPIAIALTLILATTAFGTDNSMKPKANLVLAQSTVAATPGVNLIVEVKGKVQLKRKEWPDYQPTYAGTALYSGDQLRPDRGAKVVVICADLTRWRVPEGTMSALNDGCPPPPEPALRRARGSIRTTRADNNTSIPYIISPRQTQLLNDKPTLRWNAVQGATSYTVHISGLNWKSEVSGTEIVYPGIPPLKPGVDYLLVVEANNGRSSEEEKVFGLGFSLLNEKEAQQVRAKAEQLTKQESAGETAALALAHLYIGHDLRAEAIETLEKLASTGSQIVAVYRLLGDLYSQVGLNRLAKERYLKAVELAASAKNIEEQAAAKAGLGQVYEMLGNFTEAVRLLTEAKTGYETLGDTQRTKELSEQLANLQ